MNRLTVLSDKYRIDDIIGTRPLSRTFRATDLETSGAVVVKSLHYPLWFTSLERSAHERRLTDVFQAAAEIEHASLPRIEAVGDGPRGMFVAREWLDGVPLSIPLREQGRLPVCEVARIVQQCAGPLDALASAGFQHGAITAENLILRSDGTVAVTDHGYSAAIARFEVAGVRCQFSRHTQVRSDISAFAEILYTGLVGLHPIPSHDPVARKMAEALRRAIKKRRAYASAASLADAIHTLTSMDIARQVWRPASTTGFLAAFGTICVLALSDERPEPTHNTTPVAAAQYGVAKTGGGASGSAQSVLDRFRAMAAEERNWVGLQLRRQGIAALLRPGVAEVFGLDSGQRVRIGRILAAQREQIAGMVERVEHVEEAASTTVATFQPVPGDASPKPQLAATVRKVETRAIRERSVLAVLSNLDRDQVTVWGWFTGRQPDDGEPTL